MRSRYYIKYSSIIPLKCHHFSTPPRANWCNCYILGQV